MKDQGKVAIVTGAGTGIGKGASLSLLEEGYRVVLAGRRREPLEAVAAQAGPLAERTLVVPTDVGSPAAVRALFDRTRERFGRLDLLFNNAGIGASPKPLEDLTVEEWQAVVDTQPDGHLPLHPAGLCNHEEPDAPGWAHHQQRLHLGPRASTQLGSLHGHQARHHRFDSLGVAGWAQA